MYKKHFLFLFIACIIFSACSNNNSSADWASSFVVLEDGTKYHKTTEEINVDDIAPSISKVTFYSDIEFDADIDGKTVSSNTFKKGTKIYEIKNVSKDEALVVQVEGKFIKI